MEFGIRKCDRESASICMSEIFCVSERVCERESVYACLLLKNQLPTKFMYAQCNILYMYITYTYVLYSRMYT